MRRPLVLPALFLCAGIISGYYLISGVSPVLTILTFLSAMMLLPPEIKKGTVWMIIGIMIIFNCNNRMLTMEDDIGNEITLNGTARYYGSSDSSYGQTKHDMILYLDDGGRVKVTYYGKIENKNMDADNDDENIDEMRLTGKRIQVKGILEKPQGERNPGCFDYALYLKSKGVAYIMTADSLQVTEHGHMGPTEKFLAAADKIRYRFTEEIKKVTEQPSAGVIKAMMFGLKDEMDDEIYGEFQKNGTAHLLAVSGLHMSLIYGMLAAFLQAGRKKLTNVAMILLLFVYAALSDFTPSIMRAFIMITAGISARLIHGRYDLMNAGAFALMVLSVSNPFSIFHSGFQMSFLAIFIMSAALIRFRNMPLNKTVKNTILPVLTIQAAMSVYVCYNFNYFSLTSFIANIPVTFISSLLLPMGVAAFVMVIVIGHIPLFYGNLMEVTTEIMLKANGYTYLEGIGTFDTVSPSVFTVVLFYGLFFMILSEYILISFIRKNRKRIISIAAVIIIGCGFIWAAETDGFEKADAIFIDVGQGNCMLFKSSDGKTLLVDAGGSINYDTGMKTVKPALLKNGIKKVDLAVVTHLDNDHYLGIKSLAKDGMIKKIAFYEGNKVIKDKLGEECGMDTADFIFIAEKDMLKCGKDLQIDVIAPERKSMEEYRQEYDKGNENPRSLIFKVELNDITFMVTGDIDKDIEEKLKGDIKADILQVPHHGSAGSSGDGFIDRVSPQTAVFQVGKNNYGHPSAEVIEKYQNKCIIINRNDKDGAVGFVISDNRYRIITKEKH